MSDAALSSDRAPALASISRDALVLRLGVAVLVGWLLLTERPQNVRRMAAWGGEWPANVWLWTTAEDRKRAERRP